MIYPFYEVFPVGFLRNLATSQDLAEHLKEQSFPVPTISNQRVWEIVRNAHATVSTLYSISWTLALRRLGITLPLFASQATSTNKIALAVAMAEVKEARRGLLRRLQYTGRGGADDFTVYAPEERARVCRHMRALRNVLEIYRIAYTEFMTKHRYIRAGEVLPDYSASSDSDSGSDEELTEELTEVNLIAQEN